MTRVPLPVRRSASLLPAFLLPILVAGASAQQQGVGLAHQKKLTRPVPPVVEKDGDAPHGDFHIPPPPGPPSWGTYVDIDNVEDNWVNMNPIPVRPMVLSNSSASLWACNPYNSDVARIDASLAVVDRFRTLWGPISIATYNDGSDDLLLVVCQHSNAVAVHDEVTGDMRHIVTVPPEPADIVVDQAANRAFVSCAATNEVVEIDTTTWTIVESYAVPSLTPMFLEMTAGGDVFVAPRWSGNNSAIHRHPQAHNPNAGSLNILDLADPAIADVGLPDQDLFWLNRTTGDAEAVVSGTGSILLAHGVNPSTGRYWQLNTEANNKDPNAQRVDLIRGNISFNRLTIFDLPPLGSGAVTTPAPTDIIDLDDTDPSTSGVQFAPGGSVGIPYGLAFTQSGFAFVVGKLTNNVVLLSPQGQRLLEFDLPPDSAMPRQAMLDASETFLVIWSGDNKVHIYNILAPAPILLKSVDIGFDPTPAAVQEGRRLFFDGTNSKNGNASCATCHDEGKHDMLAWSLGSPKDDKGPMVTQTLVGISKSTPFHWRGEQLNNLPDFNDAFDALLGGSRMSTGPGSDFEMFEEFVLSLTHPANPFQNRERILDASIEPPLLLAGVDSNAVLGQDAFMVRCEGCHGSPTGTNNNMVNDGAVFREPVPRRQFIKIAGFQSIPYRGWQPKVTVTWNPSHPILGPVGTQEYPRVGVGTAHAGNPENIPEFIDFFDDEGTQEHADLVAFIHQFDQGIAPAVHSRFLLNSSTVGQLTAEVGYMLSQAVRRNCDLTVFGRTTIGGISRIWAWYYSPAAGQFIRDDAGLTAGDFFVDRVALSGDEWFAFVGVPVGMGIPFAFDCDNDLYPNGLEADEAASYDVDSDGDGDWDGHEWLNDGDPHDPLVQSNDTEPPGIRGAVHLQWTTTNTARLSFQTNELTTYSITYDSGFTPLLPLVTYDETEFKWAHTVVLTGFFRGLTYTGSIDLVDLAGLTTSLPLPDAPIEPAQILPSTVIVNDLSPGGPLAQAGSATLFHANVNIVRRDVLQPVANHIVVARVFRDDVPATNVGGTATSFKVNGVTYAAIPGPFVVSKLLTDQGGDTVLSFTLQNVGQNEKIDLAIEAIGPAVDPLTYDPSDPDMAGAQGGGSAPFPTSWNFSDTSAPNRCINLK